MEVIDIGHYFYYFYMSDMGRVDIAAIEIRYSDGTTQTIEYGQSLYSYDSSIRTILRSEDLLGINRGRRNSKKI